MGAVPLAFPPLTLPGFSFQLKEFANFDFDVWRKKYMRWMNHKKSRVMDFFRRIDKDQDGKITRQEFIDGILASSECLEPAWGTALLLLHPCL